LTAAAPGAHPPDMSEAKTYQGSCHCGDVKFEVQLDLSKPATTCNCSICSRTGTMLSFVPDTVFNMKSGEDSLTDYQFGNQHIHHLFCKRCGVRSFARGKNRDGSAMVAVNVRCLEGVDLETVPTRPFDGRRL
jgi:hypothetical protein